MPPQSLIHSRLLVYIKMKLTHLRIKMRPFPYKRHILVESKEGLVLAVSTTKAPSHNSSRYLYQHKLTNVRLNINYYARSITKIILQAYNNGLTMYETTFFSLTCAIGDMVNRPSAKAMLMAILVSKLVYAPQIHLVLVCCDARLRCS